MRVKLTGAEAQQLAKRPTKSSRRSSIHAEPGVCQPAHARGLAQRPSSSVKRPSPKTATTRSSHAGLADAYAALGIRAYVPPLEGRRQAETAARKALSLDDGLAEAHVALATVFVLFTPH